MTLCRYITAAMVTRKRILSFQSFYQAADLKPLRPIRNHAIRWSATFNMLEHALYLRRAIDMWTQSLKSFRCHFTNGIWLNFLSNSCIHLWWQMQWFRRRPSPPCQIHGWYVRIFLILWTMPMRLWIGHEYSRNDWKSHRLQSRICGRHFENTTTKSINHSHVLIPSFYIPIWRRVHEKAGYSADTIENYVKKAEVRIQNEYDSAQCVPCGCRSIQRDKCRCSSISDSEFSDGMERNEFSSYIQIKRDRMICYAEMLVEREVIE